MRKAAPVYILAGDIGGTNTRLALHLPGDAKILHLSIYPNEEYVKKHTDQAFDIMLSMFLRECFGEKGKVVPNVKEKLKSKEIVIIACLACAGPILNNACTFTNIGDATAEKKPGSVNLKFSIDGNRIAANQTGLERAVQECRVVNDFVGQGYGCLDLDLDTEVEELIPGSRLIVNGVGPKVCVGAGTGLGQCYLTSNPSDDGDSTINYTCFPSEGGHVEFAPRTDTEVELLHVLKGKFGQKHRISVERVVSGKGLANVYEFLSKRFPEKVDPTVQKEFEEAGDMQAKVVNMNAKEGNLCDEAMRIMASAYGSECGSVGLKFIPTGGLFVTGGMTSKMMDYIRGADSPFLHAYNDKGRVSSLLLTVPLFAVKGEDMGLRGARICAEKEYLNYKRSLVRQCARVGLETPRDSQTSPPKVAKDEVSGTSQTNYYLTGALMIMQLGIIGLLLSKKK